MSTYEFILALGFWQWVGVLCLAGIAGATIEACVKGIANAFKK